MSTNKTDLPTLFGSWRLDEGIHKLLEPYIGREAVVFVNIRFKPNDLLNRVTEWVAMYFFSAKRSIVFGEWLRKEHSVASRGELSETSRKMIEIAEFFSGEKLEVFVETYERL